MAVELGSITLTHLTRVEVSEQQRVVHHPVPGMSGDLAQVLGRPSVTVRLHGIYYGPTASEDLGSLRSAYLAAEPVDFFTEAVGEGYFAQVLITYLQVAQRAAYTGCASEFCAAGGSRQVGPGPANSEPSPWVVRGWAMARLGHLRERWREGQWLSWHRQRCRDSWGEKG